VEDDRRKSLKKNESGAASLYHPNMKTAFTALLSSVKMIRLII
jgi:hypothetical protein